MADIPSAYSRFERHDLSSRSIRRALPAKPNAYWNLISFGKQLGYDKKRAGEGYWVAWFRTKAGGFRQKRIGTANDTATATGSRCCPTNRLSTLPNAGLGSPRSPP